MKLRKALAALVLLASCNLAWADHSSPSKSESGLRSAENSYIPSLGDQEYICFKWRILGIGKKPSFCR